MSTLTQLVIFRLGEQRYASALLGVERAIPAVEVTVLPNMPSVVFGVIDIAGEIIPVLNLRRRFCLAEREISPANQFLIVQTGLRRVALVIDEALGVIEKPAGEIIEAAQIIPDVGQVHGLIKLRDGLVLMHDLEKLLSLEETQGLENALNEEVPRGT